MPLTKAAAPAGTAGVVLTCSALRRKYRDRLRAGNPRVGFVFLALSDEGFAGVMPIPIACCQQEGSCFDVTEGPEACAGGVFVDNALCSELTGQCVGGGQEVSSIPTLSEWGMMAAAAGIALIGVFYALRRRKASA